jgi:[acyl-carrier-protein] S-malonyltransferase
MTIAWMFPGQGSQSVGMGIDFVSRPYSQDRLAEVESTLGWSLVNLTADDLTQTTYTQPALFAVEAILSDILKQQGHVPAAVAGHSLGEYSALYCAGTIDFATGLRLVEQRSRLMAANCYEGTMVAIIGFDRSLLQQLCQASHAVFIANDNNDEQVVLSGTSQAIEQVIEKLEPNRSVPLSVAGAFHSPFMNDAATTFAAILEEVDFHPAQVPVYSNFTASATRDPVLLKTNVLQQMTAPVRWRETLLNLLDDIDEVWEIGPGEVLSKLAKHAKRSFRRVNIATLQDIETFASALEFRS